MPRKTRQNRRSRAADETSRIRVASLVFGCLLALLLCPSTAAAGIFERTSNASSFARIYNASESNEDWLGYSCASIGGEGSIALLQNLLYCCTAALAVPTAWGFTDVSYAVRVVHMIQLHSLPLRTTQNRKWESHEKARVDTHL